MIDDTCNNILMYVCQPTIIIVCYLQSSTYGTNLDSLASVKSRRVGILFGRLLLRKYPQIEHKELIDISLDDLLNWSYWPNFIKIYSKLEITQRQSTTLLLVNV